MHIISAIQLNNKNTKIFKLTVLTLRWEGCWLRPPLLLTDTQSFTCSQIWRVHIVGGLLHSIRHSTLSALHCRPPLAILRRAASLWRDLIRHHSCLQTPTSATALQPARGVGGASVVCSQWSGCRFTTEQVSATVELLWLAVTKRSALDKD